MEIIVVFMSKYYNNGSIVNSNVTYGDNSPIIQKKDSGSINWQEYEKDCLHALQQVDMNSKDYEILKNLNMLLYKKDEKGLKNYIWKHFTNISEGILTSLMATSLWEFIKSILSL